MPRELGSSKVPVQLTESPNPAEESEQRQASPSEGRWIRQLSGFGRSGTRDPNALHTFVRPLTISDLEACVTLENAAFEKPQERCSREKFVYRLSKCGALSFGIFSSAAPDSNFEAETLAVGKPIETGRKDGKVGVLLAHAVATQSKGEVVTDEAMDYPRDWDSENPSASPLGHQEGGRTICLHSLGVLPSFQGKGLGKQMLTAYIQHMSGVGIADRISIIAHDHLVPFYESVGFQNKGKSKAQFGGGGWVDMVLTIKPLDSRVKHG